MTAEIFLEQVILMMKLTFSLCGNYLSHGILWSKTLMLEELGKNLSQAFFVFLLVLFQYSAISKLRPPHKLRYTFVAACVVEL
jgi:hypothetical protein